MFLQASQLLGIEIIAIDEQATVGRIEEVLFTPEDGRLSALIVKPRSFFAKPLGLLPSALIDLEGPRGTIQAQSDLTDLAEMVRVEQLRKRRTPILGQKAQTKSGKALGLVADVLIDTTTWLVERFYLQKLLDQRIVPKKFVLEITPKVVLFSDDLIDPPQAAEPEIESALA